MKRVKRKRLDMTYAEHAIVLSALRMYAEECHVAAAALVDYTEHSAKWRKRERAALRLLERAEGGE